MSQNQESGTSARAADLQDDYRGVADQLARQLEEFVTEISEELSAISLLLGDQPLEINLTSSSRRTDQAGTSEPDESPVKPSGTTRLNQLKKRLADLRQGGGASDA